MANDSRLDELLASLTKEDLELLAKAAAEAEADEPEAVRFLSFLLGYRKQVALTHRVQLAGGLPSARGRKLFAWRHDAGLKSLPFNPAEWRSSMPDDAPRLEKTLATIDSALAELPRERLQMALYRSARDQTVREMTLFMEGFFPSRGRTRPAMAAASVSPVLLVWCEFKLQSLAEMSGERRQGFADGWEPELRRKIKAAMLWARDQPACKTDPTARVLAAHVAEYMTGVAAGTIQDAFKTRRRASRAKRR